MNNIDSNTGEIVMYQPDETIRLEVRVENETVWLTQQQMADLFLTTRNNITLHIGNIFKEGELVETSVRKDSLLTATDGKKYRTKIYNLDVIISVGYRVKSKRGTQFRQWANQILKDYLLKGYSINKNLQDVRIELGAQDKRISLLEEKVDFFVRSSLPPVEGIFFDGQIFDAYVQIVSLIKHQSYFSRKIRLKKYFLYSLFNSKNSITFATLKRSILGGTSAAQRRRRRLPKQEFKYA